MNKDGTDVDDVDGDTMALQSVSRRGGGRRSEDIDGKAAEVLLETRMREIHKKDSEKAEDYNTVEVGVEKTEYVIFVERVLVGDGR